ncbi:hypothetical protein B0H21DRAFT_131633 [Amylocystis lapponica]|nr:hypothetical protein B0H21DRAFT_131633 [Amylocystis lapponica]
MEHIPEPLFKLLRGFAALVPPRMLDFPSNVPFTAVHNLLLDAILLNPHFEAYPPSREYQATFWKWAIRELEAVAIDEACNGTSESYSGLTIGLSTRTTRSTSAYTPTVYRSSSGPRAAGTAPPSVSYATYLWRTDAYANCAVGPGIESVTLLESRTMIECGTTGLRTWSASLVMAQYLIAHPELVREKRVLELGSGAGFLGVIIASLQQRCLGDGNPESAPALCLTDVNDTVLQRCRDNTRLQCNTSSGHPNLFCYPLDWSDALDVQTRRALHAFLTRVNPDVIMGADVVYDPSIIPALVSSLRLAMSANVDGEPTPKHAVVAYIALTVRNEDTFAQFLRAAEQYLTVEELVLDSKVPATFVCTADMPTEQEVRIMVMSQLNRNTDALS